MNTKNAMYVPRLKKTGNGRKLSHLARLRKCHKTPSAVANSNTQSPNPNPDVSSVSISLMVKTVFCMSKVAPIFWPEDVFANRAATWLFHHPAKGATGGVRPLMARIDTLPANRAQAVPLLEAMC